MRRFSLQLFGGFRLVLDGVQLDGRLFTKTQALLAYLVLETDRPHRRQTLAGLLWPESSEAAARASLRQALSQIRQVLGGRDPACLNITPQTVQFDLGEDCRVDANEFSRLLRECSAHRHAGQSCPDCVLRMERVAELYYGDLLAGFALKDSAPFEEWALVKREQYRRLALSALYELAESYSWRGAHEAMEVLARRQITLDPLAENAHRQILRALAARGQYGAARRHYEGLRRMLEEELGVSPEAETSALVERIGERTQRPTNGPEPEINAAHSRPSTKPPSFLDDPRSDPSGRPVFVAREAELARLGALAARAFGGQGQVAFVTGEAGQGKTALLAELFRRAQAEHPDLIVAGGNGNAQIGIGDPYLPFREILALLTGDVEARWASGGMDRVQARRLWGLIPTTAVALLEAGPDLMGTFLPGEALLRRAADFAAAAGKPEDGWLLRLRRLFERKTTAAGNASVQQSDLFEQYTRTLQILAQARPLLLILDDLQWVDGGSASLLFHLGRRLDGHRILLVGAYRPAEVAGRGAVPRAKPPERAVRERHPLETVVNEFKRRWGDIEVALDRAEDARFVDALLDTEPNRLGAAFRQMLFRQTRGHPLFVVELLRGMQARGDLVKDPDGFWVEGPALDWDTLPARVEAVIAERIGQLPPRLRDALAAASVEGEVFTAEVLARVQAAGEGRVRAWLSGELDHERRLVRAEGVWRTGDERLSRYRFRHILFQKYLYQRLDDVERTCLHEAVARALEELYGETAGEIAVQLAWHFQQAGLTDKAIAYLDLAGERALRLAANREAGDHFIQALRLLDSQPDFGGRPEVELRLQMGLGTALQALRGYGDEQVGQAFARARDLCEQIGETSQLFSVRWLLASYYSAHADHETSQKMIETLIRFAERIGDPTLISLGHWGLGWSLFFTGNFVAARYHLDHMFRFYEPQSHHMLAHIYGQDPGVVTRSCLSLVLWALGYPDQASRIGQDAVSLAQAVEDPHSHALALAQVGLCCAFSHDFNTLPRLAEECIGLCRQHGFSYWMGAALICRGWTFVAKGQIEQGIATTIEGIEAYEATGAEVSRIHHYAVLAEAYARIGQIEKGLELLAQARQRMEKSGERYYAVEVYRLSGDLYLQLPNPDEAQVESWYIQAIEIARNQAAKSWELRATMSLCRLWQRQGKTTPAKALLAKIYSWFSEGFDTADLHEARALLDQLSSVE